MSLFSLALFFFFSRCCCEVLGFAGFVFAISLFSLVSSAFLRLLFLWQSFRSLIFFFEKENPTIGLFPPPLPRPHRAEFFLDSTSILATRESVRRFFAFDRVSEAASDRDWPLCFILKL
jgi:hypothetical protein